MESSEPNPEGLQVVKEQPPEVPKSEEIFVVVMIGSRQYIVFPGRYIYTQRLKGANVNDKRQAVSLTARQRCSLSQRQW